MNRYLDGMNSALSILHCNADAITFALGFASGVGMLAAMGLIFCLAVGAFYFWVQQWRGR